MTSILALDQGTTGSTALVMHQDGRILARTSREFAQHFPHPGWVEHDPDELFRVSVAVMREAVAAKATRFTHVEQCSALARTGYEIRSPADERPNSGDRPLGQR